MVIQEQEIDLCCGNCQSFTLEHYESGKGRCAEFPQLEVWGTSFPIKPGENSCFSPLTSTSLEDQAPTADSS